MAKVFFKPDIYTGMVSAVLFDESHDKIAIYKYGDYEISINYTYKSVYECRYGIDGNYYIEYTICDIVVSINEGEVVEHNLLDYHLENLLNK